MVTVTGAGFYPGSGVDINVGAAAGPLVGSGTVEADGSISVMAAGVATAVLVATDGTGRTATSAAPFVSLPSLSIAPASGMIGSAIMLTGKNFTAGANIPVGGVTWMGAVIVPATPLPYALVDLDNDGAADDCQIAILVPAGSTSGVKTITVSDDNVPALTGSGTYTVDGPALSLSPSSGPPGTVITVTGTNFQANFVGTAGVDNFVLGQGLGAVANITITTDANGGFTYNIAVPAGAIAGSMSVTATVNTTAKAATFTVTARGLNLSPTSGPRGTAVTISGGSLAAGPAANIPIGNLTIGGVAVNATAAVTLDSLGNIVTTTRTVPAATAWGTTVVSATDSAGNNARGYFTVVQPTITLTPASGTMGTPVTITGTGWVPGATGIVSINCLNAVGTVLTMVSAVPESDGSFTAALTIPSTAGAGPAIIFFTAADSAAVGNVAINQNFSLLPPTVTVDPTAGEVGSTVAVNGQGFLPQSGVTALTIGGVNVLGASPVATDAMGAFTTNITVPGLVGSQVIATTVGVTTVTTTFTVVAAPATVASALAPIAGSYTIVWVYDATAQTWLFYAPEIAEQSTLPQLERGVGYLIKATEATTFVYGGNTYNLLQGWNSIGWLG
jgi:hypothetical protein